MQEKLTPRRWFPTIGPHSDWAKTVFFRNVRQCQNTIHDQMKQFPWMYIFTMNLNSIVPQSMQSGEGIHLFLGKYRSRLGTIWVQYVLRCIWYMLTYKGKSIKWGQLHVLFSQEVSQRFFCQVRITSDVMFEYQQYPTSLDMPQITCSDSRPHLKVRGRL